MIRSVNNYQVSQLFNVEATVVYAIPRYQREYTWGKSQWENLFDDVTENDPGYFLGSIICINQSVDALTIQELEVVDGQQRLTTLSLLFAALYDALKHYAPKFEMEQQVELFNLKRKLVLQSHQEQLRVIPQIQNHNQDDYRAVLAQIGVIAACDGQLNAGNRRIYRAFRYFQGRLEKMNDDNGNHLALLIDFLHKINQATMVKIEVASHADAYILFESLNNRGMPLTAVDLIKNKLLAKLEEHEPGAADQSFEQWNKLLTYLGDDYAIQERFFRHYYNAFKDELNTPFRKPEDKRKDPLGPVATRSNLMPIYEKLINKDAQGCLQEIMAAGHIYALLLLRRKDDTLKALDKPLKDLDRIQGAPAYLLMLYLLSGRTQLQLQNDHLADIIALLVRFFVRRNLTDLPPTRDLTRLFMIIIEKLAGVTGDAIVQVIREQLVAVSANDAAFQSKLEGRIYEENTGATRFILCALAEQSMTKESWVDLWKMENKQYIWTIEHIFPQGDAIPAAWVAMIADGDAAQAKADQELHVHQLGNLTISGFNSALGNKSFPEKQARTDSQGRAVGYKNGLKLNEDLAAAETWTVAQIEARTQKLVAQAMRLFTLDGGELCV